MTSKLRVETHSADEEETEWPQQPAGQTVDLYSLTNAAASRWTSIKTPKPAKAASNARRRTSVLRAR